MLKRMPGATEIAYKTLEGVAIYTDGTHRMIRLVAKKGSPLRRLRRNFYIGICTEYRKINPKFAGLQIHPGFCWVGNYNDEQGQTMADFDKGKSRWDSKPYADNIIEL